MHKFWKLTLQEKLSITRLWILMAIMDIRLKFIPHRWNRKLLFSDLSSEQKQENVDTPDHNQHLQNLEETSAQLIKLIRIAANHHLFFNMSCLRRSLVLRNIFLKRGYPARLVYGAESKRNAHAWVEIGTFQIDSSSNPADFKRFQ